MAPILVRVVADNTGLKTVLNDTSATVKRSTGTWSSDTKKSAAAFAALGAVVASVGVTLASVTVAATTMAANFEAKMRNVNSIAKLADGALADLSQSVLDLTKTLPVSAQDAADALYDIESSGFAGSDALKVLKASAQAGVAGLTDTSSAANAVTSALNAYGLSAADAGDVSDILFKTVDLGVINFNTLSDNIGKVAPNAAAAKIGLADVGAAIATITLSGQSGEVAATSLSSLITKLAAPAEQLAAVYKSLGYTSGEAALAQKGLSGVLLDLQKVTGGSLSGLQLLLQDTEATRGATALLSNGGSTYARVLGEIADKTERAGATQDALAEQMKATNNRIALIRQGVAAFATEQGLKLLPAVNAVLAVIVSLGSKGAPVLTHALAAMAPLLRTVADIGANLGQVLAILGRVIAPVAVALAKLGGTAVVATLTAVLDVLDALTGALADSPTLVLALAAALVGILLPGLVATEAGLLGTRVGLAKLAVQSRLAALGLNQAGLASTRAAVAGANWAKIGATVGWAAALVAVALAWQKVASANADAQKKVDSITGSYDALDPAAAKGATKKLATLATAGKAREEDLQDHGDSALGKVIDTADKYNDAFLDRIKIGPAIRKYTEEVRGAFTGDDAVVVGDKAEKALKKVQAATANTATNVGRLSATYGVTEGNIRALAKANDVDLTKPYKDSASEVKKLADLIKGTEVASGTGFDVLANAAGGVGTASVEAITSLQNAIKELRDATASAVASSTDVLGTIKPGSGDQAKKDADDALAQAQAKLADVRSAYAGITVLPASAASKIADAQADVAKALADQSKAAKDVSDNTLAGAYKTAIEQAGTFSADITKALTAGLDPKVIAKLLAQGPAQAGPVLTQILSDHSGRLVKLVNDSEEQIAKISAFTVEQARLTALATNAATDGLSRDLPLAMRIAAQAASDAGATSADALARILDVPADQVLKVAQEYGITLGAEIAKGVGVGVGDLRAVAAGGLAASQTAGVPQASRVTAGQPGFASGGYVLGAGTTSSDSIPAWLSTKEYVMRANAVQRYGLPFMHAVNTGRLRLPGFAGGGYVGAAPRVVTVTVPVSSTHRSEAPIHVQNLYASDVEDFERQAAARRRLTALNTPVSS